MKFSKELKAGLIVLSVLASFYWMAQFLKGKNLFSQGKHYYIVLDQLNDLDVSRKVKIKGFQIGHVEAISPRFNEKSLHPDFVVKIKLDKNYKLTDKTLATIKSPGITQGAEVVLTLFDGNIIHDGDTIKGGVAPSMLDQFTPTQNKLDSVLLTLNTTLKKLELVLDEKNRESISRSLENINTTMMSFRTTSEKYGKLADNANGAIQENRKTLSETLVAFNTNMKKFGEIADQINNAQLDKTLLNMNQVSSELSAILVKVNNGEGTLGAFMNDKALYNKLDNASNSMDLLLKDVKDNPKKYVHFSIFGGGKNKK